MRVIGYVRVSTREQAEGGHSIEAQEHAIQAECEKRGWELLEICKDLGASGRSTNGRPGLAEARTLLSTSVVDGLVVAKLDRLSRSMQDFADLLAEAQRQDWALVLLDFPVDTTTPHGKMISHILAALSQWERELIGQRTREGLDQARRTGTRSGRPIGRPPGFGTAPDVVARMARLRDSGASFRQIADELNADGVPTSQGGRQWYPATIRKILGRAHE